MFKSRSTRPWTLMAKPQVFYTRSMESPRSWPWARGRPRLRAHGVAMLPDTLFGLRRPPRRCTSPTRSCSIWVWLMLERSVLQQSSNGNSAPATHGARLSAKLAGVGPEPPIRSLRQLLRAVVPPTAPAGRDPGRLDGRCCSKRWCRLRLQGRPLPPPGSIDLVKRCSMGGGHPRRTNQALETLCRQAHVGRRSLLRASGNTLRMGPNGLHS